jgi:hypothetical protein
MKRNAIAIEMTKPSAAKEVLKPKMIAIPPPKTENAPKS